MGPLPERFRFGSFELDRRNGELRKSGLRIHLENQPFRVLAMLSSRPGEIVTRDELKEAIWASDTHVDFDRGLTRAVNKMRLALGDSGANPRFVETVPRRGYRFVAPVTHIQSTGEELLATDSTTPELASTEPPPVLEEPPPRRRASWTVLGVAVAVAVGAAAWWALLRKPAKVSPARSGYERGMALIRELSLPKVRQGIDELRQSVQDDPNFAPAWAGLSQAAILLDPTAADTAIEYARRSVDLDPGCGECHGILGKLLFTTKWNWEEAGIHLEKASALKPDSSSIQVSLAMREAALGRVTEALHIIEQAAKRFPEALNIGTNRAQFLYLQRDYDGAIRESDRMHAMNLTSGLEWKAYSLFQQGRHADAIYALHGFLGSWSSASPDVIASRRNAAVTRFMSAGLPAALGDLLKLTGSPPAARIHSHNRARWLMLLGRHDEAIKELTVAVDAGLTDIIFLKVDPVFDPIRSDPAFRSILRTVRLDS